MGQGNAHCRAVEHSVSNLGCACDGSGETDSRKNVLQHEVEIFFSDIDADAPYCYIGMALMFFR